MHAFLEDADGSDALANRTAPQPANLGLQPLGTISVSILNRT